MTIPYFSIRSLALILAVALGASYAAASLAVRPSIMPDPSYGFTVFHSMQRGAPWNNIIEPDPEDIAKDRTYFFTVWSPGQYAVPGVLVSLGASLGAALTVVLILGSLAALSGWLFLFLSLGFDATAALVSCALIAATRAFNFSFLSYNGSEFLALATFPWIAAAIYRARRSSAVTIVAALGLLAGFYAKNSMVIYVSAWTASVVLVNLLERRFDWASIWRAILTLVALGVAMAIIYVGFIARGWTPLATKEFAVQHYSFALPWAMPALAGSGLDDILSWLFQHPSQATTPFDYKRSTALLGGVAAATAFGLWAISRQAHRRLAAIQAAAFVGAACAVFFYLFITNSSASVELSRHYRPLGYVLLPLLVAGLLDCRRRAIREVAAVILIIPCAYGVLSFGANWRRHYQQRDAHSARVQVTHLQLTPRVVHLLTAIDGALPGANSLVVTPTAMHALEFTRVRTLPTSVTEEGIDEINATPKRGRVDNLIVIAEMAGMSIAETDAWLRSFHGYANRTWEFLEVDQQRFYVPSGQAVDRAWLEARLQS